MIRARFAMLTLGLFFMPQASLANGFLNANGHALMQAVYERHKQYPYVYEEQSMVLIDRNGNRETRKVKRYSRVETNLLSRILLLFESPKEVKGVAVLAERSPGGEVKQQIYLPSLGQGMIENSGEIGDANFLGTDFSVENLTGEVLEDYDLRRQRDIQIDETLYYIVDVFPNKLAKGNPLRRHYICQDNLFITRTDYFDDLGRLRKRQSHHDLTPVLGDMWQANMLLMENMQEDHQTLIKVDRRVYSADYVPAEVFTPEWLYQFNQKLDAVDQTPDEAAEAELLGESAS